MHPIIQIDEYNKEISQFSNKTYLLGSRPPRLDSALIVSHQLALGFTFCDVFFAIGPLSADYYIREAYSDLCVFLYYSVVYQHI